MLPQAFGCFADVAATNYTLVTSAKRISALYPVVFDDMPHNHKRPSKPLDIHPTTQAILRQLAGAEWWVEEIRNV